MARLAVAVLSALVLAACSSSPSPTIAPLPSVAAIPDIDCGPVVDPKLCQAAVAVAVTAKVNPPPLVAASIRRPRADDDCATWFHPCGPDAVVVQLQSGDVIEEVPLVRTTGGWVRLDLVP